MTLNNLNNRYAKKRDLQNQFLTLTWLAYRNFMKRLQRYGLTHPQFLTLYALVSHGQPATMRQLSEVTFQDAPTMTGIVNRLIKMELVQRTRSEQDRRVVWVETTDNAIALLLKFQQDLEQEDPHGLRNMSETQMEKMEQMIDFMWSLYQEDVCALGNADFEIAKLKMGQFALDPIAFIKEQETNLSES